MNSVTVNLTSEERLLLKKLAKQYSYSWQIAKRLEAIRLIDSGLTVNIISQQLCVNQEIVYKYIRTYKEAGLLGLVNLEKPGKESLLNEERMTALEKHIEECRKNKISCTTQDQVEWVKKTYGVDIGAKWLYKRLLVRKQKRMDSLVPVISGIVVFLSGFMIKPGYYMCGLSHLLKIFSPLLHS